MVLTICFPLADSFWLYIWSLWLMPDSYCSLDPVIKILTNNSCPFYDLVICVLAHSHAKWVHTLPSFLYHVDLYLHIFHSGLFLMLGQFQHLFHLTLFSHIFQCSHLFVTHQDVNVVLNWKFNKDICGATIARHCVRLYGEFRVECGSIFASKEFTVK